MKPILTILLLSLAIASSAQRLSKSAPDREIVEFMVSLFQSDTAFNAIRHVDNDILSWQLEKVTYPDSASSKDSLYQQSIFFESKEITRYITKQDVAFFVDQIERQRDQKWNLKFKGIRLHDTVELVGNRLEKTLFSYSLPLFSIDGKHALIIEAFFCGLLCGGGSYNLYERQVGNTWRKIMTVGEWAE